MPETKTQIHVIFQIESIHLEFLFEPIDFFSMRMAPSVIYRMRQPKIDTRISINITNIGAQEILCTLTAVTPSGNEQLFLLFFALKLHICIF